MENVNEIIDSFSLLEKCKRILLENVSGTTGGNRAECPVLITFLDEESSKHLKDIADVLLDNWSNARFLEYIKITTDGKNVGARLLNKDAGNPRNLEWNEQSQKEEVAINEAVLQMKQQNEKVFNDQKKTNMYFILNASDDNALNAFDVFAKINASDVGSRIFKTLFIMIDQGSNEKREKAQKLLDYVNEHELDICDTVYILSNMLSGGHYLGEEEIWKNYRLISNIILLGSNNFYDIKIQNLFGGMKTVTYVLLTKPNDEIASYTLYYLLAGMKQTETEESADIKGNPSEVKRRIGFEKNEKSNTLLKTIERIYKEEVKSKFPAARYCRYLPFLGLEEYKNTNKGKENIKETTGGAWKTFIQRNYIELVKRYLDDVDKKEYLRRIILDALYYEFTLPEFKDIRENWEIIKNSIKTFRVSKDTNDNDNDNGLERYASEAEYEAKQFFYEIVINMIIDEMERMISKTEAFVDIYNRIQIDVENDGNIRARNRNLQSSSVHDTYKNIVQMYLNDVKTANDSHSTFNHVLNVNYSKSELLQKIYEEYARVLEHVYELDHRKEKIFEFDFENEFGYRMNMSNPLVQKQQIDNILGQGLRDRREIRLAHLPENQIGYPSKFYLINENAEYAKEMKKRCDDPQNTDPFVLFDLSRTDCIEVLEIEPINNPKELKLLY